MNKFAKFIFAVWCSLFILAACDDGKVLDDPEYNYHTGGRVVLRVHLFHDYGDLRKALDNLQPKKDHSRTIGFAVMQRNIATREPNFCDIFVIETPYGQLAELSTWGHELKHCLEGNWHPDQD